MALKLTGALNCIPNYTSVSMLRIHLAYDFQMRVTAKIKATKLQTQSPPWVISLLTSNSPQQLFDEINVS